MTITSSQLVIIYAIFFMIAIFFSVVINALFLKFSKTLGIRNKQDTIIRWSPESKPAFGGISFYIVFLLSITAYSFVFENNEYFLNLQFLGVLFASTLGFLMGLFDDAINTVVPLKLFTQITCGLILISTGTVIDITDYIWLNYAITMLWVVGIMNSINMLDNMDGITSTVSIFVIIIILVNIYLSGDIYNAHSLMLLGVLAGLLGFLRYNWNPSKMFMGDTGSQFLGAFLSSIGIIYFWNVSDINPDADISKRIIATLLAFSIPIIDTTTVSFKRIAKGSSPFVGGKDHTTHHLSYIGISDGNIALIFAGISTISLTFVTLTLQNIWVWNTINMVINILYFVLLFIVLFYIANLNKHKN